MEVIKISIITINFNNSKGLVQTLDSVAQQTYNNYEHIIIDGASTDGSKSIIEQYKIKILMLLTGYLKKTKVFIMQ